MNLLGIDFEEWYHPELIKKNISTEKKYEPSVINGIDKILDWLRKNETNATFFVVGELLEIMPELLDKIIENDHEISFHTMHHTRLGDIKTHEFSNEINEFSRLTEKKSKGFRAPTFSLDTSTSWAIDVLEENDYLYDSSVVPAKSGLYGIPNAEEKPYRISSKSLEKNNEDGKIHEFPILTTRFLGKKIPAGGGFYLRTLPMKIIKNAIKNNEENQIPSTFYIHSWELTPEFMPRLEIPTKDKFITYHNLEKALPKMTELLQEFRFTSFMEFFKRF
tara:strand:+ start:1385 stop:2215 length:831 start_codon:yes stop_codon:yes gene_type:complete